MLMSLIWLHLTTLPAGYFLVSRFYPEDRLPWPIFLQFAFLTLIWPIVLLVVVLEHRN